VFWLRTGIVSNKEFSSPDSLVLQRRGWIIGSEQKKCPAGMDPPPCWMYAHPLGVDTVKPLIGGSLPDNGPIAIEVAHRELAAITASARPATSRCRIHLALGFHQSGGRGALRQRSSLLVDRRIPQL